MSLVENEVIEGETLPALAGVDRLINSAITNGLDVEALGKLIALRDAEQAKQAAKSFIQAMGAFQAECPVITKRKSVTGGTNHNYAPIEDIYHVTKPLAHKHGFTHWFDSDLREDGVLMISCWIAHVDGHQRCTTFPVPPTQGVTTKAGAKLTNSAQDMGIMRTYGERYAYQSAFSITIAGADMDGRLPEDTSTVSAETAAALRDYFTEAGGTEESAFLGKQAGVSCFEDLLASSELKIRNFIRAKAEHGKNA